MTSPSALDMLRVLPVPPVEVRKQIPEKEWQMCIQSWAVLCHSCLSLPLESFKDTICKTQDGSIAGFLASYMQYMATAETDNPYLQLSAAVDLRRSVFLVVHRAVFELQKQPDLMTNARFLGDLSRVYKGTKILTSLLEKLWTDHEFSVSQSIEDTYRRNMLSLLERGKSSDVAENSTFSACLLPLLRACPSAAKYLLTGSDFSDAVVSSYPGATLEARSKLLLLMYLCLLAPLRTEKPNRSLLVDHLYTLVTASKSRNNSFLPDLVTNTPFMSKFQKLLGDAMDSRATNLFTSLRSFRNATSAQAKRTTRRGIVVKGKGKARVSEDQPTSTDIHVHRISLVTQLQDLFPDLGDGFVVKLLDEYADDVEQVTAHLLEDNLPNHLRDADRSEQLSQKDAAAGDNSFAVAEDGLLPRTTPPSTPSAQDLPIRRNIYDNDAFDTLQIHHSQLHTGRQDDLESTNEFKETASDPAVRVASKAAILSALSAFDADDDERDDTYDLADVGGTVDAAAEESADERSGNKRRGANANTDSDATGADAALLSAYQRTPEVFARDAATRRGAARRGLREETGLADEAIEGWAVMAAREPGRLRRLEERIALSGVGGGAQRGLERTAWRGDSSAATTDDDGEAASSGGEAARGGGGRGRGRGRGGRGRGGGASDVAGPSGDATTQRSRQRKEAGKGSRANHNRRDQRARKMARGGGGTMPG